MEVKLFRIEYRSLSLKPSVINATNLCICTHYGNSREIFGKFQHFGSCSLRLTPIEATAYISLSHKPCPTRRSVNHDHVFFPVAGVLRANTLQNHGSTLRFFVTIYLVHCFQVFGTGEAPDFQ